MAKVDIYGMPPSAPCRILYMTCNALGVEYNDIPVDLFNGGNKTPEYLKMNPQHTVPTLKDGDFCMNESRAAATYLISKYGKDDKLYPKYVATRAVVDQRLYFDMGTFYKAVGDVMYPQMFAKETPAQDKYDKLTEVMGWVTDMIKPTGYVAGTDHMTIADICFVATVSTGLATEHFDWSGYPEIMAWLEKMKGEIPDYEKANGAGVAAFSALFKKLTAKE